MNFIKKEIKACCGKHAIVYKFDAPLTIEICSFFKENNFVIGEHFIKAGILYVHNLDFILKGTIGSSRLQVKCKSPNCIKKLNYLEDLLQKME